MSILTAILLVALFVGLLRLAAWWVDTRLGKVAEKSALVSRRLHATARDADRRLAARWAAQIGAVSVDLIIMVFVAIVILYQLIPSISNTNTTVQNSANVSAMGKFAAGLGEWLFPLFGLLGLVFLLWRQRGSMGGGGRRGRRGRA